MRRLHLWRIQLPEFGWRALRGLSSVFRSALVWRRESSARVQNADAPICSLRLRSSAHGSVRSGRLTDGSVLVDHPRLALRPTGTRLHPLRWHIHRDATVTASVSAIITDAGIHISPSVRTAIAWSGWRRQDAFSKGPLLVRGHGRVELDRAPRLERLEDGIFLGGFAPTAFYHHVIERVLKLAFLPSISLDLRDVPLLVPREVLDDERFLEPIHLLAPDNTLIGLDPDTEYRVKRLVWVDELSVWGRKDSCFIADVDAVRFAREAVLDRLGIRPQVDHSMKLHIRRGVLARSDNDSELFRISSDHGFIAWRPEELSFADQVRAWSSAGSVVGDTGAAWTNVVFSPAGSRGAVLRLDRRASGWSSLATVGRRRMTELFSEPGSARFIPDDLYRWLAQN